MLKASGETQIMTKYERAYKLGYETALACYVSYLKSRLVTNPYTRKELHKEWRRGWLAGCDVVLDRLRAEGKCIDA